MTDFEAVEQLVLAERQSRVMHRQKDLEDCYWDDATVTTSWTAGSADAYLHAGDATSRRAEADPDERIINRSVAPLVHMGPDGDRAWAELPTESNHWIKVNGVPAVWTSYMQLVYRCEKRDGVWKVADLSSLFNNDKLAPVVPGADLRIDPKELEGLRPAYFWMSYIRRHAGGQVSDDMPGTDRPEDVARMYDYDEKWVKKEA